MKQLLSPKPPKPRKHDITALETIALDAYAAWLADDNAKTRTALFTTIQDLTLAILEVGNYAKYNIDFAATAYEYALYLFQRFLLGSFRPTAKDRFPLHLYITKNIRHVIITMRSTSWREVLSDMEFLVDTDDVQHALDQADETQNLERSDKRIYVYSVLKSLRVFYSEEEIARHLPLALDILGSDFRNIIPHNAPLELRDFLVVLIATAKRLVAQDNIFKTTSVKRSDLKQALKSAARSTVFLSTVVNSDFFEKELLLSLDIDSLYRLVSVSGGKTIKVPTLRELDTVLGAVVTVSNMVLEGKALDKSLDESRKEYDLVFSNKVNINQFISRSIESVNIFGEDKTTEPMVNLIASSIKSLDIILRGLEARVGGTHQSDLLKQYIGLSDVLTKFTDGLVAISQSISPSTESRAVV